MKTIGKYLLISLIVLTNSLSAQNFSLLDIIRKQFNVQEQTELDKAQQTIKEGDNYKEKGENLLNKAEEQKQQAQTIRRKKKQKKALQQAQQTENAAYSYLIRGSKKYAQANSTLFNLYYANLSKLADNIYEPEKSQLLELLQKAKSSFDLAKDQRSKATKQNSKKDQYTYHKKAEEYEKQAIALLIQAYAIYFRKIEEQKQSPPKIDTAAPPAQKINIHTGDTIIYRVQIAASKIPLSHKKLREIYPNISIAHIDKEGGWYKYLIGEYTSYEEAYQAKKKMNVKGAFIVAYKNGKRVKDIREVCNPEEHPKSH